MTAHYLLYIISFFLFISDLPRSQPNAKVSEVRKPNIILILTDDQGWADVGFNGCKDIPTPNLDRIARQGVVFKQGYVSHPYCSPSRAGLLTGRYQARFGHDCNLPYEGNNDETIGTPSEEVMIPEALKPLGYRSAVIGKWHVGDHPDVQPLAQGFDHWFGFVGGNMNFWGIPKNERKTIYRNDEKVAVEELSYLTDDFTEEAIDFISRDTDQPFFVYLAYNAPHSPDHATEKYLQRTKHIEYGGRSVYGAMVNAIDEGVGRIDSTLRAIGKKENTIIVFLSDNGGRTEHADNRPYRGHKGMLFEGGIRVPFFMTWPEGLPSSTTYHKPVISLDLFPTFLEAAGEQINSDSNLNGVSLLPYVKGEETAEPHDYLYWRSVGGFEYAVRDRRYKFYKSAYKEKDLLFDLDKDQEERFDISEQHRHIVQRLKQAYQLWDKDNLNPAWVDPHPENVVKEEERWREVRTKSQKN